MSAEMTPFKDRRTRSRDIIRKLVDARTNMLSLYSRLAENHPFKQEEKEITALLNTFCSSLIDYTAEAHFHLYQYFANNNERRGAVKNVAEQVYNRISDITQRIVDFNDRYANYTDMAPGAELEKDLSSLGELLADRIELEDQLIDAFTTPNAA